jgi:hypothetical protein
MALIDDLIESMRNDWSQTVTFGGSFVRVRLLRSNFEIWFEHNPAAAEIRAREGEEYAVPIGIKIVNANSGKAVRGFDTRYLHPWWVRRFVYEIAAAVGYIEREWDVMSEAFIEKMQSQETT